MGPNVYFARQILLLMASCMSAFAIGLIVAFPSVLNPAILAPNADIQATSEQASWITACFGISAIPALAVIPTIFDVMGRKTVNIMTNVVLLIGCIIQYVANDIYSLALSRICQGIAIPGLDTFVFGISECSSPQRRGYFMVLQKVSIGLGSLACHTLGFVLNWRQIAILNVVPICLSILFSIIISESPSFFAYKGKFEECEKSFKWYRGDSLNAKKELKELLTAQMENFRLKQSEKNTSILIKTKRVLTSKDFRKSFFIVILAKLSIDLSGRHFLLAYITQILVEVTSNIALSMYLSIISDLLIVSALCISCLLVKRFNRKALLLYLGFFSVFIMFIVTLSLILRNRLDLLSNVSWLTPTIILLHLFIGHVGLIPVAFTLGGEMFTLEHRGIGLFLSGIISLTFYTVIMKIIPMMITNVGVEGVYCLFGLFLLICLIVLRVIFIETKDKALQEIEDELKGIVRRQSEMETL